MKNQNDKSNPAAKTASEHPGSKSHQEQTQEGKKKTEIDPNNPVANKNKYQGSQQDKKKHEESGKLNAYVPDIEENEEEIND